GNFCSCKDALYRNTTCKHQLALAVYVTQQGEALANVIHLWRRADLLPLCGEKSPKRFSQAWLAHIAANWPDCCRACKFVWDHPQAVSITRDDFYFNPR